MAVAPVSPFQWVGNEAMTPAQAQEARSVAAALSGRRANVAQNGWEGLAQLANAFSERQWRDQASQAETAGQASVAEALAGLSPQSGFSDIASVLSNPWVTESPGGSAIASALLQQNMQNADPMRQIQMETAQLELERMRNPQAAPASYINVGDGTLFNETTGEFLQAPGAGAAPDLVELYDETTGLPYKAQWNPEIGDFERVGGVKAPSGTSLSVDPATGAVSFTQGAGMKPLNESQSKDTVYATRASNALPTVDALGDNLLSFGENVMGNIPYGNYLQSEDYQLARDAGLEFLASILRKDTGAAVTTSEEALYGRIFLPQPGDKPATVAAKQQRRALAVEAIKAGMPPQALENMAKALDTAGGESPREITSQDEYEALPSGTQFIAPDGSVRVKP